MPKVHIRATVFAPLWQNFDYVWPSVLGEPQAGIRIVVPFGHSKRLAVVEQVIEATAEQVATTDLKQVLDRLDDKSLYSDDYWGWLQRASSYYLRTTGEMYELALAWAALDKQRRFKCLNRDLLMHVDKDLALAFTSKRAISLASISKHCEVHALQWRVFQAVRKGVLEEAWGKPQDDTVCVKIRLQLRSSQQKAVAALCENNQFYPTLLFGRTGSGKTEVYLQAAEKLVAQGKQVLILVPEIGLTPMWKQRLAERFEHVSIWHSGLTKREKIAVRHGLGNTQVLLGTRSALFLPLNNLGMIVIDEEVGFDMFTNPLSTQVKYLSNGSEMYVAFSFDEPTIITLQVYNMLGQEMYSKTNLTVENDMVKIMDRQKVMGTYLIRVDTGDGSTVGKVIY